MERTLNVGTFKLHSPCHENILHSRSTSSVASEDEKNEHVISCVAAACSLTSIIHEDPLSTALSINISELERIFFFKFQPQSGVRHSVVN